MNRGNDQQEGDSLNPISHSSRFSGSSKPNKSHQLASHLVDFSMGKALVQVDPPSPLSPVRNGAIILCSPVGHEYYRAYYFIRQLALALSEQGFHAIRFDWWGHGDSDLHFSEVLPEQLVEQTREVKTWVRETLPVRRIGMVGMRLGAGILAQAQTSELLKIRHLLFWDPLLEGDKYWQDLKSAQHQLITDKNRFARALTDEITNSRQSVHEFPDHLVEVFGTGYRLEWEKFIQGLTDVSYKFSKSQVRVLLSKSQTLLTQTLLTQKLPTQTLSNEWTITDDDLDWLNPYRVEARVYAKDSMQLILDWVQSLS